MLGGPSLLARNSRRGATFSENRLLVGIMYYNYPRKAEPRKSTPFPESNKIRQNSQDGYVRPKTLGIAQFPPRRYNVNMIVGAHGYGTGRGEQEVRERRLHQRGCMPFDRDSNGCKSKLAYKRNHAQRSLGIEWPLGIVPAASAGGSSKSNKPAVRR